MAKATSIFDLKLAKNIRFANKRVNVGVDVYNLFNNDAIRTYEDNFTPLTTRRRRPSSNGGRRPLLSPRFARFSMQFDF